MLLALKVPAGNERGPRYMQEALAAIHQAGDRWLRLTLELGCHDGNVGLYCRTDDEHAAQVTGLIAAKYPHCRLDVLKNEAALEPPLPLLHEIAAADLVLTPDLFPILRHNQYEDTASHSFADPIDALLRSVEPDSDTHARIEIAATPTRRRKDLWARWAVDTLNHTEFRTRDRTALLYARTIMHPLLWPFGWLLGRRVCKHANRQFTAPVSSKRT